MLRERLWPTDLNVLRRLKAALGLVGVGLVAGDFLAAHIMALPARFHRVLIARVQLFQEAAAALVPGEIVVLKLLV